MPDPDRFASLTGAERRILMLLAAGHTAKTAAAALGISVYAVNERLREARRKTGAGSSRDLARAVAAQEIRDEKIGVERDYAPAEDPATGTPQRAARRHRGALVAMSLVAIAAVAGAMIVASQTDIAPQPTDALLGSLIGTPDSGVAALHRRVRTEPRDPAWANRAETDVADRYARFPGVSRLRVMCAATLCEVAGVLDESDRARFERTLADLQNAGTLAVERIGLRWQSFGVGGHAAGGAPFVAYLERVDRAAPRVVSTSPADGAAIRPGPFTLSVTFDRAMRPGSYSFTVRDQGRYPDCAREPTQSSDGRTFTLACTAKAGARYAVGFNSNRFTNFRAAEGGTPARPAAITFTASR